MTTMLTLLISPDVPLDTMRTPRIRLCRSAGGVLAGAAAGATGGGN